MFIDELIGLPSENDTEVVKAVDDPFELTARYQLDDHMVSIPPNSIQKLVLDINTWFHNVRPYTI